MGPNDKLFEGVRYLLDDSVDQLKRPKLEKLLQDGSAQPADGADCTHIITETLDSLLYEQYKDSDTTAFITSRWVAVCWDLGNRLDASHYSPDPAKIFSGVIVCTSALPGNDADHIKAIVLHFGGHYRNALVREVTHLVTLKPEGDKYDQALRQRHAGMQIVLPHWIWDSLRVAQRVPEYPFRFPDPPLFHPAEFDPKRGWKQREPDAMDVDTSGTSDDLPGATATAVAYIFDSDHRKNVDRTYDTYLRSAGYDYELQPDSRKIRKNFLRATPPPSTAPRIFENKTVYIARSTQCDGPLLDVLDKKIQLAGGTALLGKDQDLVGADESLHRADIVICYERTGWEYWLANDKHKVIGSVTWLIFCLSTGQYAGPRDQLLHYPLPPGRVMNFDRHISTLTNYSGPQRDYLKRLVDVMGGTFDGELRGPGSTKPPTTILIAAQNQGRKAEFARDHDIDVVNHVWLERCFIEWRNVPVDHDPIFKEFPAGVHYQDRVGRAALPKDAIAMWANRPESTEDRHNCLDQHCNELDGLAPDSSQSRKRNGQGAPTTDGAGVEDSQGDDNQMDVASSSPAQRSAPIRPSAVQVEKQLLPSNRAPGQSKMAVDEDDETQDEDDEDEQPSTSTLRGKQSAEPKTVAADDDEAVDEEDEDDEDAMDVSHTIDTPVHRPKKASTSSGVRFKDSSRLNSEVDTDNVVVSSSKRLAATKAAVSVSASAKDMTKFAAEQRGAKKRRQSATATDFDEDEAPSRPESRRAQKKAKKREQQTELEDEEGSEADELTGELPTSSTKPQTSAKQVRILFTGGSENSLKKSTLTKLKKLGVVEADSGTDATHVCLQKQVRTEKYFLAMINKAHFVTHEWAEDSIKKGCLLDEADYPLTEDVAAASERARRNPPVLEGHDFYLTSAKVTGDIAVLKKVIKAAGGNILEQQRFPEDEDEFEKTHVISCEDDKQKARSIRKKHPNIDIRVADFVIHAVLTQELKPTDATLLSL